MKTAPRIARSLFAVLAAAALAAGCGKKSAAPAAASGVPSATPTPGSQRRRRPGVSA